MPIYRYWKEDSKNRMFYRFAEWLCGFFNPFVKSLVPKLLYYGTLISPIVEIMTNCFLAKEIELWKNREPQHKTPLHGEAHRIGRSAVG